MGLWEEDVGTPPGVGEGLWWVGGRNRVGEKRCRRRRFAKEGRWMGGWVGGWVGGRTYLVLCEFAVDEVVGVGGVGEWVGGWVGGRTLSSASLRLTR